VDADHGRHPARGAAGTGDLLDSGVEVDRVGLETAVPLGLQQSVEPGLLDLLDGRVGNDPQSFRLLRA
jgi:hypothetical protein